MLQPHACVGVCACMHVHAMLQPCTCTRPSPTQTNACTQLSMALMDNTSITSLNLSCNHIGDEGVEVCCLGGGHGAWHGAAAAATGSRGHRA